MLRKILCLAVAASVPAAAWCAPGPSDNRAVFHAPTLTAKDVPGIAKMLKSSVASERMNALMQIQWVHPPEATAGLVPAVINILQHDTDQYNPMSAAQALGSMPPTDASVRALAAAVQSSHQDLARSAASALPAVPQYLWAVKQAFASSDWSIRKSAIEKLRSLELPNADVAALLKGALTDPNEFVRISAGQVIADIGKGHTELAPQLVQAVAREIKNPTKSNLPPTSFLMRGLVATGGARPADLPLLIELLRSDPEASVRYSSAQVIGTLGVKATPAIAALVSTVEKDSDPLARGYAAEALGKIGPPAAKTAVPALSKLVKDRSANNYRFMVTTAGFDCGQEQWVGERNACDCRRGHRTVDAGGSAEGDRAAEE